MKSKELVLHLNEGRKDMAEKVSPMLFHRNMVLSNPEDADFPHRLLFTWDSDKWAVAEASEATRVRYRRRDITSSTGPDVTGFAAVIRRFNETPKNPFTTLSGERFGGKPNYAAETKASSALVTRAQQGNHGAVAKTKVDSVAPTPSLKRNPMS